MKVEDAACLVTGASSGIGLATATRLAHQGARVVGHGRDKEALGRLAAATGSRTIVADLTDPAEVDHLAREALTVHGRLDVLVNNAGAGWAGPFVEMDDAMVANLVALNLLAPIRLTRAVLPVMLAHGAGHVVNVASIAGALGVAGEAVYAATKAGLQVFSDSLRDELRDSGVCVSVVVPGAVGTPFFERRGVGYARRWPRPVPSERVAEAVVHVIRYGRREMFVPRWLALAVRLRGASPRLYRLLAGRFG